MTFIVIVSHYGSRFAHKQQARNILTELGATQKPNTDQGIVLLTYAVEGYKPSMYCCLPFCYIGLQCFCLLFNNLAKY